mgnify:CR=1 FL=1
MQLMCAISKNTFDRLSCLCSVVYCILQVGIVVIVVDRLLCVVFCFGVFFFKQKTAYDI